MELSDIIKWLTEFVAALQNPAFLIFFCSLIVGAVIKNTAIPIPSWLIPSLLAFIGLLAGAILLGAGWPGRFTGALQGMTLALASTGFHQIYAQIQERYFNAKAPIPALPPPPAP